MTWTIGRKLGAAFAAQARAVATMDPHYKTDFEAGVKASDAGAAEVEKLHDPQVTAISTSANDADHTHDATVNTQLFPAVERGDREAALRAMTKADAAVGVVFSKLQAIGAHIESRHEAAEAAALSATAAARRFGILSGLLAVVLAAGAAFFVVRGIRRAVAAILERLTSLTEDADALAGALDSAATGDLTVSVSTATTPIVHRSSDEIGRVADAVNTIRERTQASSEAYNRMVDGLRELITDVSAAAGTVSASSQQMAGTADEAGRAVGEIASAIGDVAHGAEQQVRTVATSRELSDELRGASETSATTAEATAVIVARARELAVQGAAGRTEQGAATVQQAGETFLALGESVEETGRRMQEIAAAIGAIASSSARMREQMDEVATVAERSSATTEHVSAASEETSASAQEIAASAQDLAQTASSLEALVGRFTLSR